jgi:aminomethyltransferase
MGEIDFLGRGALDAVQKLITNDLNKIGTGKALYTAVCRPDGGIVDACIVYRRADDDVRIVVNAANIAKDFAHFREHAGSMCDIVDRSPEVALIAVQGPRARGLVGGLTGGATDTIAPFCFGPGTLAGASIVAARTGYTGEDGFELFVDAAAAPAVWNALAAGGAQPIGLGARDTLRLEARLCLYGNDIDETTTPLEAGLGWVVKLDAGDFVGRDALVAQKSRGIARSLVGFVVAERGIARPHAEVLDASGAVVGGVTSGGPGPTVGEAIGMAYVPVGMAAPETAIVLRQRSKNLGARIVKGPFYKRSA